ncbi:MAG: DnaJ domain-containing protein [Chloroflexota bacterium]|nr:DnaJ domain-containing protein [Chloroflexota bacterium]
MKTSFDHGFLREIKAKTATRKWDERTKEWAIDLSERQTVIGIVKRFFGTDVIQEKNKPPEERRKKQRPRTNGIAGSAQTALDPDYTVLHLLPSAPPKLVDTAYRTLAQLYHPDVNTSPDANAKMKNLNRAYDSIKKRLPNS